MQRSVSGKREFIAPRRPQAADIEGDELDLARLAPVDVRGDTVVAPVTDPGALTALVRRLDDAGLVIAELALRSPSLDEVFLGLTGAAR